MGEIPKGVSSRGECRRFKHQSLTFPDQTEGEQPETHQEPPGEWKGSREYRGLELSEVGVNLSASVSK